MISISSVLEERIIQSSNGKYRSEYILYINEIYYNILITNHIATLYVTYIPAVSLFLIILTTSPCFSPRNLDTGS